MGLKYLRQNSISSLDSNTSTNPAPKKSGWKFSKGKFSFLLGGNLIIWVIFIVSFLDIDVFSMSEVSLPKIQKKLAVSGIVYNEKNPTVIISSQVYGVGDLVSGYTISRITQTEVEFEKNGKKLIRQTR